MSKVDFDPVSLMSHSIQLYNSGWMEKQDLINKIDEFLNSDIMDDKQLEGIPKAYLSSLKTQLESES